MERFAFKIDAALKANLCKICRLCGIDNPQKVPILLPNEGEITDLDDPSLYQKVYELVGLTVTKNDKMPQTMCNLCVDKINDFYEFREMCYATNNQTRKLLGLKPAEPQKLVMDIKQIVKTESLIGGAKRGRKRKSDEPVVNDPIPDSVKKEPMAWRKKLRLQHQQQLKQENKMTSEIKDEPADPDPPTTTTKLALIKKGRKSVCSVCGEKFEAKDLMDEHKNRVHVPWIPRYFCNACNQTHQNQSDIRAHQLWHKLSKAPYKCPLCDANVANAYAFARHLREHTPPTPLQLQVLDRECPLCKKTFVTNFFYNTHPCAIRKRKCGGCSRPLSTEGAYMRHAPSCSKIYLSHSKHILPEVVQTESQMRIKNEVEDEQTPSTVIMPSFLQDDDMQPMVVLERLASPLLRASAIVPNTLGATTPSTSKSKSNERVSSKKYLKRVDQLLRNTMSTLVSIKHEPEVHINDTGPTADQAESDPELDEPPSFSDFHATNDDDDSDGEEATANGSSSVSNVFNLDAVKQEPVDNQQVQGKQGEVQIKQEPLKLKLKITNNHGQLNSSIMDDHDETQPRGSKKKKKRKHKERQRESLATPTEVETLVQKDIGIKIKEERMDNEYADGNENGTETMLPQATVMTSIPMTQLEGNYNDDTTNHLGHQQKDAALSTSTLALEEMRDVKPNRLELDRLMKISHVASGVDMAEEAMETAPASAPATVEEPIEPLPQINKKTVKSTARKSTGGGSTHQLPSSVPQIVAVESGASVNFNIVPDIAIKPEPQNRGYADEMTNENKSEQERPVTELAVDEVNHNEKVDEENAYINSLDFNNITIKQEKDLDITDMTANGSQTECINYNGQEGDEAADSEDEDDDSASSADEAEEQMEEEEEERIYQEIELQPLEKPTEENSIEKKQQPVEAETAEEPAEEPIVETLAIETAPPISDVGQIEANPPNPDFKIVITSVCSQADESISAQPSSAPTTEQSEKFDESTPSEIVPGQAETLPSMSLTAAKDNEIEAQPFLEPTSTINSDEEQQNVLNHEIFEQQIPVEAVEQLPVGDDPVEHLPVESEEQLPLSASQENQLPGPNEETENRINELQQQEQLQLQMQVHQDQVNDDSNINEIAENNNNANIERELQDDANGAQENVNI
ncbi:RE1-silencing transcription factor A isoform X1 [Drosophila tropicalis]|uniref:RE1-silencing transcription factor A isoform X1 n=2 Tax=Drosophila tropicalis TaxID=46794 RepID=UPI0035ABE9B3